MSGFDNLAVSLGIHHVDSPAALPRPAIDGDLLAKEMKVTFDLEELASFFSGFVEPSADTPWDATCR